jgi:hypothetical protein
MAGKQMMPNQCTPLHFIYGANNCCLCNSRDELERFKTMVQSDMEVVLSRLPEESEVRKLLAARYGTEKIGGA